MSKWLNKYLIQLTVHYIRTINQIPDFIGYYSPLIVEGLPSINEQKLLPSQNNHILHLEKALLFSAADRIALRFQNYTKINLIAISEVSIEFASPLLYEFAQKNVLTAYTTVTPNSDLNNFNIKQVGDYLGDLNFTDVKLEQIIAEPELDSFGLEIGNLKNNLNTETNLFLLLGSRLGNSPDPERMLKNITQSMQPGDHLVILQGLLNLSKKDLLLRDYQRVLLEEIYKKNDDDIIAKISKNFTKTVDWFDEGDYQGVELKIKLNEDSDFEGIKLEKGREISIFRTIRFTAKQLEDFLNTEGLATTNISFDDEKNFGLYIAKKTGLS